VTYIASPADQYSFTPPYTEEKKATSTGHLSNHYWSLLVTSTTSPRDQYWSDCRPVLVDFTTYIYSRRPAAGYKQPSSGALYIIY